MFPVGKGQFIQAKAEGAISPQDLQYGQPVFAGFGEINGVEGVADQVGVTILAVDASACVIYLLPRAATQPRFINVGFLTMHLTGLAVDNIRHFARRNVNTNRL